MATARAPGSPGHAGDLGAGLAGPAIWRALRGRPRTKGARLETPAQIAAGASWQAVTVRTYGKTRTVQAAVTGALWHGNFNDAPGQLVLVKDPGSGKPYDLALFTPGQDANAAAVIERYSWRWPIEPSNAAGQQIPGVGEACNRLESTAAPSRPASWSSPC